MKPLTKAEEQVMQVKIIVDKGYIGVDAMGRVHRYFSLVSKESYSTNSIKSLVDAYFEGSFSEAVSCMLQQKEISVQELELLLNQLKQSKK